MYYYTVTYIDTELRHAVSVASCTLEKNPKKFSAFSVWAINVNHLTSAHTFLTIYPPTQVNAYDGAYFVHARLNLS